jgi:phage gpG-like protein
MIRLKIDDRQVQAEFQRMLAKSKNPEPANAAISARMLAAVEDNFRAEGRPTKWAALRPSTLAARAAAGKSGKILQASGHLARSITPFHSRFVAGVGTNVPYAAAMNNGSKPHVIKPKNKKALAFGGKFYKRVNHPGTKARPFMVLVERDKADLLEIMALHIMSGA